MSELETDRSSAAPPRYRRPLVVLHWLLAVIIVAMLALGFLVLAPMANADPAKIAILRWHIIGGVVALAVVLLFAGLRWRQGGPERLTAGSRSLDRLSLIVHRGFYLVVPLIAVSGIATSALAGLPPIVFGGSGAPLPASFLAFPSFRAHALLALLLVAMIALHLAGALYHQFVRRDQIFARMALRGR